MINGFNLFSLDVHRGLAQTEPANNAIVSGYRLATALSLTMAGTANDSRLALTALLPIDGINFSAMLADNVHPLNIGEFKQKARIEVDKDGTRAAVATVVASDQSASADQPQVISIDRPFWYAFRDRTSGLLFSGRVVNAG